MSQPHCHPPYAGPSSQATHTRACSREPSDKATNDSGTTTTIASTPIDTPPASPPDSPSSRSPENRTRPIQKQREIFSQHLTAWALNHDSSVYFHGSISLHPQGTGRSEDVELGKSVSCMLTDASTPQSSKKIVIRLFRSHRYDCHAHKVKELAEKDVRYSQSAVPYQMLIRSGSGWVPARQYFDKHYFAYRLRLRKEQELVSLQSSSTSSTSSDQQAGGSSSTASPTARRTSTHSSPSVTNTTAVSTASTHFPELVSSRAHNGLIRSGFTNEPSPRRTSSSANNTSIFNDHLTAGISIALNHPHRSLPLRSHSRQSEHHASTRMIIKIQPLFRPFLRLPKELQDEILFRAVGHTRNINLKQAVSSQSAPTSPITISKLFQISKSINYHMVPHIFRSTNFHFGITGFTKFLWQLGPLNRAALRHLTFDFSKASLLHCIRWMAPDPVWEIFEPPVSTNPPTLMYFWRCQLQELMKELNLSTLTVDIKDVPLADVPMLVKIISFAMGSVERVRIIDSNAHPDKCTERPADDSYLRSPDLQHSTWRELSLQYHNDYRYQRWHMKHILTLRDVDLCPMLNTWMNKDVDFFDS